MSEKAVELKKRLAESVGEFIKYWGFKEIHGRIWVHVYLSSKPITAKELTETLGVTKGLISTALSELVAYQVVERVNRGDARSPGYRSNTDLVGVIYNVLRNRELKLTNRIQRNVEALAAEMQDVDEETRIRLNKLRDMSNFAVESLNKLLHNKTISTSRFRYLMRLLS